MELIDQSHKIWGISPSTYDEAMLWVERAARTCYNSIFKIKPGSAEKLIDRIMSGDPPHSSVLEHVSIYALREDTNIARVDVFNKQLESKWLEKSNHWAGYIVSGNLRAWMEALKLKHPSLVYGWLSDNNFTIIDNEKVANKHKRVTVELITDRAILAELSRHRDDVGLSVESQRYVNYGDGVTFIKPSWYETAIPQQRQIMYASCIINEEQYKTLRNTGLPPQHARTVLNSQVKTTIVMSAYLPEWKWIFKLRTAAGAYPQMIDLMKPVEAEFKERSWV